MTKSYEFCFECGSLKEQGTICKNCTKFLSKKQKISAGKNKNKKNEQELLKDQKEREKDKKKKIQQIQSSQEKTKHLRTIAKYSEEEGLEIGWDLETPERSAKKRCFCVKCRNWRERWEGIWVVPGGKGISLDPEVRTKRVFLCGMCWSPYKTKKKIKIDEEEYFLEERMRNPL